MGFDFWSIIFVFTWLQALLLAISFFTQKQNKFPSRVFGFLLFVISIILAEAIARHTMLYRKFPHILGLSFILNYLIGPLYFLYFKVSLDRVKWKWIYLLNLIPLSFELIRRFHLYVRSGAGKIDFFEAAFIEGRFGIAIGPVLFEVAVNMVYIILTVLLISEHQKKNQNRNWRWAKILSYCFLGFWMIYLVATIYMSQQQIYSITFGYIQNIGLSLIVIVLSYYLMHKSEVFSAFSINRKKYSKSEMRPEERLAQGLRLLEYLKQEKPFLDNQFNQSKLSEGLGLTNNKISQILNEELHIGFHDLINNMRVEEMKLRLMDPQFKNITIMGIAFDVGFNSKTSMIRNFKKITNLTPSEFIKTQQSID